VARRHVCFRSARRSGAVSPALAAGGARDRRFARLAESVAQHPANDWRTDALAAEAGFRYARSAGCFAASSPPASVVRRTHPHRSGEQALLKTDAPVETSPSIAALVRYAGWIEHSRATSRPRRQSFATVSNLREAPCVQHRFRDFSQSDAAGFHRTLQVLSRLPDAKTHIVAKSLDPVRATVSSASRRPRRFGLFPTRSDLHSGAPGSHRRWWMPKRSPSYGGRRKRALHHVGLHRRFCPRHGGVAEGPARDDTLGLYGFTVQSGSDHEKSRVVWDGNVITAAA